MNPSLLRSASLAIGILIGLLFAFLLIRYANNNKKVKVEYDERQNRVRGDAYRYAFYSILIYETILLVLEIGEVSLPIPNYALHFGGILFGCIVLSAYCIWKDAYWGLNNNRRRYGAILVVGGLLNAIPVISSITSGTMTDGGTYSFSIVNLMVCIMLLFVGAELLIKQFLDKRASKTED